MANSRQYQPLPPRFLQSWDQLPRDYRTTPWHPSWHLNDLIFEDVQFEQFPRSCWQVFLQQMVNFCIPKTTYNVRNRVEVTYPSKTLNFHTIILTESQQQRWIFRCCMWGEVRVLSPYSKATHLKVAFSKYSVFVYTSSVSIFFGKFLIEAIAFL